MQRVQGLNRYVDKITGSFVCRATRGPVINRHVTGTRRGNLCIFLLAATCRANTSFRGVSRVRGYPRSDDNWRGLIRKTKRHVGPPLTWTYGFGFRNNSSNGN